MKKVNIMDTTLRDGSYAINFSFTSSDTEIICRELEKAGIHYIEIGHGVGLNASNQQMGVAAQTDEEYMVAAESALRKSQYGMFCIPGIARLEDIDLAGKHGMGFIRIGTNVTEVESSKKFIERAKDYGMFVTANYMKSYAVSPARFAKKVKISEKYGCDLVYVVDSAGGMFRQDIERYYDEIRKVSVIPLGFHGHDNLGLAVSNSLESIDLGFSFIDSSLQGLGRSSGNAPTEVIIAALKKRHIQVDIDLLKILNISQEYILPLLNIRERMPLDIISGFADFHSSYMGLIQKYSVKYHIDPALLIIEICKINKIHVDEKRLDEVAKKIKRDETIYLGKYQFSKYIGNEEVR